MNALKKLIYDPDFYYTKPRDAFADMLSCAFAARPRSARAFNALCNIKRAFCTTGVGLNAKEEAWLKRLAKRGGWRKPKENAHAH